MQEQIDALIAQQQQQREKAREKAQNHIQDPNRLLNIMSEKYAAIPSPTYDQQITLAEFYAEAGDMDRGRDIILAPLRDPSCLDHPAAVLRAADALIAMETEKALLGNTVQTLLTWARSANRKDLDDSLTSFSVKNGIGALSDYKTTVDRDILAGDISSAAKNAIRAINKASPNREQIRSLLEAWHKESLTSKNILNWQAIIERLTRTDALEKFTKQGRGEVVFYYASYLYEEGIHRKESLRHFEKMMRDFPEDTRSWIPLYTLFDELGKKDLLDDHLDLIIPQIEKNPGILANYPINLETLRATRNRSDAKGYSAQESSANLYDDHKSNSISLDLGSSGSEATLAMNISMNDGKIAESTEILMTHTAANALIDLGLPSPAPMASFDWRQAVRDGIAPAGSTERVLNTAFANELEKHLAIQSIALLTGEFGVLSDWHWRVWQNADDFGYPLNGKDRHPKGLHTEWLDTPLHSFLTAFSPIIARACRSAFLIDEHMASVGSQTPKSMPRIGVDHPALSRSGIARYKDRLELSKVYFMHTPGLRSEVFLDGSTRCIHFDTAVYQDAPPTILLHKICYHLWAMRLQYHVIAAAHVASHIGPLLQAFSSYESATPMERLKIAFGAGAAGGVRMEKLLDGLSRSKISTLAQQASPITSKGIRALQIEMRIKVYRLILSESLDLIGVASALSGQSITRLTKDQVAAVMIEVPMVKDLLEFATKIVL